MGAAGAFLRGFLAAISSKKDIFGPGRGGLATAGDCPSGTKLFECGARLELGVTAAAALALAAAFNCISSKNVGFDLITGSDIARAFSTGVEKTGVKTDLEIN